MSDLGNIDPDLPWTIEVDMIRNMHEISLARAIEVTCIRYLKHGDVRALAWFLREGHKPEKLLCDYLGAMLAPDEILKYKLPFALIASARDGRRGRRPNPERDVRDWLIYKNVAQKLEEMGPGSYDAALSTIAELDGLERPTVKRAYEAIAKIIASQRPRE